MNHFFEKIYYELPVFFQNVAISLFGWYWFGRRYKGIFKEELKNCIARESFDDHQWHDYHTKKLRSLLLHSYHTVPYYRNLFRNSGIDEVVINNFRLQDLYKIPFLEKQVFRDKGTNELLSEKPEPKGEFYSSSGSTGTPTRNLYSKRMHQTYFAIFEARLLHWAGLDFKVPRGVIGGRRILRDGDEKGPYYRYNFVEKQTYFSAYHLSPKTVKNYVEGIIKNKVEYLTGYASANYFLARFIEEAGIEPPKIKAVLTSADKLTPEMRETFKRVYGCETFDSYNGVEATCLISECEYHKLHIVPDVGIVEILDTNGEPVKPGEVGEVITTGLLNYDQPLIRYRMGDLVKLAANQNCECGRHMPVIEEIIGRIEDTVIGPDGREMTRFHGIFYNIESVIEGQVIQYSKSSFEIKLVVTNSFGEKDGELMKERMRSQLGDIDVRITLTESIPRSANGKFKSVISHVKR